MINDSFTPNISTDNLDRADVHCPEEEPYTSQKRFVRTSLYAVTMVLSLFGNVIIICIVRKNRRMRNLTHYLIVNMAVADLLITVLHMPYILQTQLTNSPGLVVGGLTGKLICKLVGYSQDVSIATSVFTLMAISIDRFMAVVFPLKRVTLSPKARYVIVPIWIISIVICSPLLYVNKMEEYEGEFQCYEDWGPLLGSETAGRYYTVIQFALFYIVPLIVIAVLHSYIALKVWNRHVPVRRRHLPRVRFYSVARRKLLRMLFIVVCLFAACWLPYHVVFLLDFFSDKYLHCLMPETIMFYCLFAGHSNSALNPCVYFTIHKEYRKGLLQVIRRACCLRVATISSCLRRQKNSFNLQVDIDRAAWTVSPTSYLGMLNKKPSLNCDGLA